MDSSLTEFSQARAAPPAIYIDPDIFELEMGELFSNEWIMIGRAGQIPDHLGLNITDLHVGGNMTAADLELPEGVELVTSGETVVAHIEEPRGEALEEAAGEEGAAAEPEVISKGGEKQEEEG